MKLQSMRLQNFRQFFGEQEIEFASPEGGRNVTVFHGYNGAGKTALLNAFIWCLYGQTTSDLEAPERLTNERAVAEAAPGSEVAVTVRLVFIVHGERYIVERRRSSTKDSDTSLRSRDPELLLWAVGPNGQLESIGANDRARQSRINQILPPDLYPFFFFNGERVERLASKDAYDRIESGITTLLDVKIFERGTDHLRRHVAPALAEKLKKFGDADLQTAISEQQRLETQEQEQEQEIRYDLKQVHENVARLEEEIDTYEQPVFGASTGEKQILALSFVASLVKKAAQNLRESETNSPWDFPTGGPYPLVLDSSFGTCHGLGLTQRDWLGAENCKGLCRSIGRRNFSHCLPTRLLHLFPRRNPHGNPRTGERP